MLSIDKYAYNSKIKDTDPLEKLFFAMLTLEVCICADWWVVSIAVLVIMTWMIVHKSGMSFNNYLKLMLLPGIFLILSLPAVSLGISTDIGRFLLSVPIFHSHFGISKAGLFLALNLLVKAVAAVSCLYFLALTTPMVDMLTAFRRLKFPELLLDLTSLIYRFIFILLETTEAIFTAQNSRLGYINLSSGYRSLSMLVSNLFIRSYKRAGELYTALECRGYDGELKVLTEKYPVKWANYMIAVVINLILIFAILLYKKF